ncbi:MAG: hypothetical protein PHI01_01910 [Candidatus Izemoplasmatales bacterium]|nr:hypothetical protein [Candidatus Izemoplasmatales bacterium]
MKRKIDQEYETIKMALDHLMKDQYISFEEWYGALMDLRKQYGYIIAT